MLALVILKFIDIKIFSFFQQGSRKTQISCALVTFLLTDGPFCVGTEQRRLAALGSMCNIIVSHYHLVR